MRWCTKLMVPVLIVGLAGVADAKGKNKHATHDLKGKIVSISGGDVTIARHHHGKKGAKASESTKTIHTTNQTTVTIGGVGGKSVANLAPGEKVRVKESGGTATNITVTGKLRHHQLLLRLHLHHHHHKKK